MNENVFVNSEINTLKKVIVHRPDNGISRISPKRSEELLFDDIVFLEKMQEEHDQFTQLLNFFIGEENVLEAEDLLRESLVSSGDERADFIKMVVEFEEVPTSYQEILLNTDNDTLAKILISGYHEEKNIVMFDPIPNFIFTRDIAVTVKDYIIITKAAKTARERENLLTRFIFFYHPLFKKTKDAGKLINLNIIDDFPPNALGERVSIEGGDIMVLQEDYILIGTSERTSSHAFESLKKLLLEKDIVEHVVKVEIPDDRSCMHIDTVFTRISNTDVAAYKPIIVDGLSSWVKVYDKKGNLREYQSIKEFFINEINKDMRFILSGDGVSPYQEREQWTDSVNLVALKPGVAVSYDRNVETEKVFIENGYKMIHIDDFLVMIEKENLKPSDIENTIIALNSTELSRARGGSHCMTCPILRAK